MKTITEIRYDIVVLAEKIEKQKVSNPSLEQIMQTAKTIENFVYNNN